MVGIDQDDVIQILRMLEESTFDELHLEMGDLKLVVSKGSQTGGPAGVPRLDDHELDGSKAAVETPARAEVKKPDIPHPPDQEAEGLIVIKAPMLGTFYRAPKPGAPPFVEVGQEVSPDDSVCIIEVMKLFNTVKANLRGRIAKICAENGQMVEYQETLFLVESPGGSIETSEEHE